MAYCYYTCNLLPLDLLHRAGYLPRWLGNHLRGQNAAARRDALSVHPLTCPYVTKLLAAAEEALHAGQDVAADADRLVVPGGCDAMRRLGDLLAAAYPDRVHVIHIPRASSATAVARLAADLATLEEKLVAGRLDENGADSADPLTQDPRAIAAVSPAVDYPQPPRPEGVFVVSGPLSDDSLLGLIHRLGSHVAALESCTSPDRWRPLAPTSSTIRGKPGPTRSLDYQALAEQVLAAGMCPRRSTNDRRAYLEARLEASRPTSVIYARQSFCDPGAYDSLLVGQLARERGLPYLEIEVDFPFDASGPLRTRVEAFLEAQLLDDDLLEADDLFEETQS